MYQPAEWRLISFNFGLHNLNNGSAEEGAYEAALVAFTARLRRTPSKLVFVATTPFMPLRYYGNTAVEDLNAIAARVMAAAGVPYADLYKHITARCGDVYTACDICDNEAVLWPPGAPAGSHCGYHYTAAGYTYIAAFLSGVYAALL